MGYEALLFCPDDKTARVITQVLSELEFHVEACTEPFAAVKKLMGQHFDAVVVDCDNEQNATLLFKSARNSTSNQGSLAVAVVEGQAGVARAFRIGANLVLTKPINIEQTKGTLRVARGLLRKGEPAKPGAAPTTGATASRTGATPASSLFEAEMNRPLDAMPSWPTTTASAKEPEPDEDLLGIGEPEPVAKTAPPVKKKFIVPAPQADKTLLEAEVSASEKAAWSGGSQKLLSTGAAAAPAPARERVETHAAEVPQRGVAEVAEKDSSSASRSIAAAPTFTFGGNVPAESSGRVKKFVLIAAALLVLAIGAYATWTHFHGRSSEPENPPEETAATPVETHETAKPSGGIHAAAPPATTKAALGSEHSAASAKTHAAENETSSSNDFDSAARPGSAKAAGPEESAADTPADSTEQAPEPLVVKGGKTPTGHIKATDTAAPSMIGIAAAGTAAPPPDLGAGEEIAPKPMLQTLNISQGVSRGLLYKKVQPVYPANALALRIEGSVELMATISKTGDITHVKVLSGDSQLSKAAVSAVKQWKYKPYLLNGEPVEIQTQVTINFKLPK